MSRRLHRAWSVRRVDWDPFADALGSRTLWLSLAAVEVVVSFLSQVPEDVRRPLFNLAAGLVSSAALLAVVGLGWTLVLRRLGGGMRIVVSLPVLVLAGTARGVTLQALLVQWGMSADDPALYAQRVMNSLFVVLLGAGLGVAVAVRVDRNRERLRQLEREQARLAVTLAQARTELRADQRAALTTIRQEVVDRLQILTAASPELAANSLRGIAAQVVRPLSHEIAASVPEWQPPQSAESTRGLDWSRVWAAAAAPARIAVTGPVLFMLVLVPTSAVALGLWPAVVLHAGASALVLAGLLVVRRLPGGLPEAHPTGARLAVTFGWIIAACLPAAAFAYLYPEPGEYPVNAAYVVGLLPLVVLLFTVLRAARAQQRALDAELRFTVAQTRWWLARVRMQGWCQLGELARALHGPVQTVLHAAAQRLQQAVDGGFASPELVNGVLRDVEVSLTDVLTRQSGASDLRGELFDLTATWQPLVRVEVDLPDRVTEPLTADPVAADLVGDVVAEAVSNAVRHGAARTVRVAVDLPDPARVVVSVRDDGTGFSAGCTAHRGLGLRQLDECALRWAYALVPDGHLLTVEFPFLRSAQSPAVDLQNSGSPVGGRGTPSLGSPS